MVFRKKETNQIRDCLHMTRCIAGTMLKISASMFLGIPVDS